MVPLAHTLLKQHEKAGKIPIRSENIATVLPPRRSYTKACIVGKCKEHCSHPGCAHIDGGEDSGESTI